MSDKKEVPATHEEMLDFHMRSETPVSIKAKGVEGAFVPNLIRPMKVKRGK